MYLSCLPEKQTFYPFQITGHHKSKMLMTTMNNVNNSNDSNNVNNDGIVIAWVKRAELVIGTVMSEC